MRLVLFVTFVTFVLAAVGAGFAAEPNQRPIELNSELIGVLGLPLAESAKPVFGLRLTATVDEKGEGDGALVLDPSGPPAYDEFGFPGASPEAPTVKLDCHLKLIKTKVKTFLSKRPAAPESEAREFKEEWRLYSVTGSKITSRLFLSTELSRQWSDARLLVQGDDGKIKYAVDLRMPPQPQFEPCHPGCFPAGAQIAVPGGKKAAEAVEAGDLVTTVNAEGEAGQAKVAAVFVTRNRLIEVRTDGGDLITTATQPLSLARGGLRAAGELKAGDRIHTWDGRKRQEAVVREVKTTDRQARVFNLILGEPVLFVANGFLARSKPPAPAADPTLP